MWCTSLLNGTWAEPKAAAMVECENYREDGNVPAEPKQIILSSVQIVFWAGVLEIYWFWQKWRSVLEFYANHKMNGC